MSLGSGGLLELRFMDNRLTNSGDASLDLHIFEVGTHIEDTFVEVRPTDATALLLGGGFDGDGDGFFEVGRVFGSTDSIDLDQFFPGFGPGELLFDAVQLIDDPFEGSTSGLSVAADIDSVAAIESVPEPGTAILLATGLAALAAAVRRRSTSSSTSTTIGSA